MISFSSKKEIFDLERRHDAEVEKLRKEMREALQFTFGLKHPEKEKKKLSREYIEKHARPREPWEQAASRLKSE